MVGFADYRGFISFECPLAFVPVATIVPMLVIFQPQTAVKIISQLFAGFGVYSFVKAVGRD
jgi:hypothetical protein